MAEYAPDYVPEGDKEKFEGMLKLFSNANTPDELQTMAVWFIMDMTYPRQDIHVALRKAERLKGWG